MQPARAERASADVGLHLGCIDKLQQEQADKAPVTCGCAGSC
jgi:hypothetical protein